MPRTRLALAAAALACLSTASSSAFAEDKAKDPFTVNVTAPAGKAGAAASARIEVKPAKGYHMNKEFPTSLQVDAPAGVDVPKAKLTAKEGGIKIEEQLLSVDVAFTPKEAGQKVITGMLKFAVCTETNCVPAKTPVRITVEVK